MTKKIIIFLVLAAVCCSCTSPEKRYEQIVTGKLTSEHVLFDNFKEKGCDIVILYDHDSDIVMSYSLSTGKSNGIQLKSGIKYDFGLDSKDEYMWFISDGKSYLITFVTKGPYMYLAKNIDSKLKKTGNKFRKTEGRDIIEYTAEEGRVREAKLYSIQSYLKLHNISNSDVIFWERRYNGQDASVPDYRATGYRSVIFVKTNDFGKSLYQFCDFNESAVKLADYCGYAVATPNGRGVIYSDSRDGTDYLMYYDGEYEPSEIDRGSVYFDYHDQEIEVTRNNGTEAYYNFNGDHKSRSKLQSAFDSAFGIGWDW